MIILKPPHLNPKDKRLWANVLCCGELPELHAFAKDNFIGKDFFDAHYFLTVWLLDGKWHYQESVNLQASYWITETQYESLKKLSVAYLWMGKSRRWELFERGLYSSSNGVIPSRVKVEPANTGIVCAPDYPANEVLAHVNSTKWHTSPARQRLIESIDLWIADNLGQTQETKS
jgi:hypothetical protein